MKFIQIIFIYVCKLDYTLRKEEESHKFSIGGYYSWSHYNFGRGWIIGEEAQFQKEAVATFI